jgi:hypothetical protein
MTFAALALVALASIGFTATTTTATRMTPVVMLPSCEGLPQKTCFGDRATGLYNEAGTPDESCAACMQQSHCCDAVGFCDETPGCMEELRRAHACVLDGGPGKEADCLITLGSSRSSRSRAAYDCMRLNCGDTNPEKAACKISNCNVNPAVVLLANPGCDKCLGGSCCQEVNACYGDRRCKLALECIVTNCRPTLGREMSVFANIPPTQAQLVRGFVCGLPDGGRLDPDQVFPDAGFRGPPQEDGGGPDFINPAFLGGECVGNCLQAFAPTNNPDDINARCLAFNVYTCGARSGCGEECNAPPDDGGTEASTDASGIIDGAAGANDGGDSGPQ